MTLLVSQECPPADTILVYQEQNDWEIPTINNWNQLEVMTWNIKTFPLNGNTLYDVQEIIADIMPDIINFQEISNFSEHEELAALLPAYEFIFPSDDPYFGLDIAFRKDCVSLNDYSLLFSNYGYEFAWRYPLSANLIWNCGDSFIEFEMINVHFKCCDDGFERRFAASEILSEYINQQTENGKNIISAGDYNDSLDDLAFENSLLPLIDNNNVYFVDFSIAEGTSYGWSYPSYPSHIDHILINSNLYNQNFNDTVLTLRVDDYVGYNYYHNNISDHRPVYWKTEVISPGIPDGLVINEIMNNPNGDNEANTERFELTNIGNNPIVIYGLILKDNDFDEHIINQHKILNINEYLILGSSLDLNENGNIVVDYKYENFSLSNLWDELIILHPIGTILDEVEYDYNGVFPNIEGASMMLINSSLDNYLGDNWISSFQDMENGDFGTPGYSNSEVCNPIGDVNLDNVVNILDVVLIVNFILNTNDFDDFNQCQGDIDQDNNINVVDIVLIVGYILDND